MRSKSPDRRELVLAVAVVELKLRRSVLSIERQPNNPILFVFQRRGFQMQRSHLDIRCRGRVNCSKTTIRAAEKPKGNNVGRAYSIDRPSLAGFRSKSPRAQFTDRPRTGHSQKCVLHPYGKCSTLKVRGAWKPLDLGAEVRQKMFKFEIA